MGSPALAQAGAGCGAEGEALFQCDVGAKQVSVCRHGYRLTYAFGPDRTSPELSLSADVSDVDVEAFDGTAAVTFRNGDTRYRVHVGSGEPAVGGIDVTLPSGAVTALACDAGSVRPRDAFAGLERFAAVRSPHFDVYGHCFLRGRAAEACAGIMAERCAGLDRGPRAVCYENEVTFWEDILGFTLEQVLAVARDGLGDYPMRIERAQGIWEKGLAADCMVAGWTVFNVMDGDLGELACRSQGIARRVDFLRAVKLGLEFEG